MSNVRKKLFNGSKKETCWSPRDARSSFFSQENNKWQHYITWSLSPGTTPPARGGHQAGIQPRTLHLWGELCTILHVKRYLLLRLKKKKVIQDETSMMLWHIPRATELLMGRKNSAALCTSCFANCASSLALIQYIEHILPSGIVLGAGLKCTYAFLSLLKHTFHKGTIIHMDLVWVEM